MRSIIIVESFPLGQFLVEIHIVGVGQQLIELFTVRTVGSLDLAIELRSTWFDVDMAYSFIYTFALAGGGVYDFENASAEFGVRAGRA